MAIMLIGCGHAHDSQTPGAGTPPTGTVVSLVTKVSSKEEASSFLSRATFGAREEDIDALFANKNYSTWIDDQFNQTPSYHLAWMEDHLKGISGTKDLKDAPEDWGAKGIRLTLGYVQRDAWWDIVVNGNDQLRQRVAFALSEIMVVSKYGFFLNYPDARVAYYDILVKDTFANFRTLLEDVTLSPMMGKYLSYMDNRKADPAIGNHPDENYAREVMQLFTVGLYQLYIDGSQKKDAKGIPLATYTQKDVQEMAKVFTGWVADSDYPLKSEANATAMRGAHEGRIKPMIPFEGNHDTSEKHILGHTIPSGQNTREDLKSALDILFGHPNVGPFIAKRLIQRLVTSNPSPEYINHVASTFNDNGHGIRGDMKAVIKAVLLDPEAMYGYQNNPATFGKVREPLLCISHLWRAFHATKKPHDVDNRYRYDTFHFGYKNDLLQYLQQKAPLEALTVFNYFTPEDGPYELKKEGLVAPEFQILGIDGLHKVLMSLINIPSYYDVTAELGLSVEEDLLQKKNYDALLNRLDLILLGGNMSDKTKSTLKKFLQDNQTIESQKLAHYLVALVMTSADYAVQR